MATEKQIQTKPLAFNGKPISTEDAVAKIADIWPKRVDEIIAGLNSGDFGQCSVAGGYIQVAKEAVQTSSPAQKSVKEEK